VLRIVVANKRAREVAVVPNKRATEVAVVRRWPSFRTSERQRAQIRNPVSFFGRFRRNTEAMNRLHQSLVHPM
jgi:hypothetical protein